MPKYAKNIAVTLPEHAQIIPNSFPKIWPTHAQSFGIPDNTIYENVQVPVLIVAGENDPLREPGYSNDLASRIPENEHHVIMDCGHCPNIEHADKFNELTIDFLKRIHSR